MCGIAGVFGGVEAADERVIGDMINSIVHRGPDDWGIEVIPGESAALGMRRLSIVDLEGGHQPMWSEDRAACLVFNGEIYNAGDLRIQLLRRGHRFRTDHSDTEVVVEGFREWGDEVFERLNGMFAVAIWDRVTGDIVLARDRAGEKPLYLASRGDGGFAFASEMKAILSCPGVDRGLDFVAIDQYLSFDYIVGTRTPFKAVTKVSAGAVGRIHNGAYSERAYWYPPSCDTTNSGDRLTRLLDDALDESVRARMVADVPVGLFLSGGLDSSTVGWYMRKHSSEVHSYSIGFEDAQFDETAYANEVARSLGTRHHQQVFRQADVVSLVEKLPMLLDEPMADQSILPTYLLSMFTRGGVKVALGGDGSDELWMGYKAYKPLKIAWLLDQVPGVTRAAVGVAARSPQSLSGVPGRAVRFANKLRMSPRERQVSLLGAFGGRALHLLAPDIRESLQGHSGQEVSDALSFRSGAGVAGAEATVEAYFRGYLQQDILAKVDRASMAASLEVRSPFLDPGLIDLAFATPTGVRLDGWTGKQPLRQLMRGRLPDSVIDRTKQGFGVPVNSWLRESLAPLVCDYLGETQLRKSALFDEAAVTTLVSDHLAGRRDNGNMVWVLLVYQMWHERWAS